MCLRFSRQPAIEIHLTKMMHLKNIFFCFAIATCFFSCKSKINEQQDQVYSRHLQRQVPLTVITTPMPDNKKDMNLLLVNSDELLQSADARHIIDSLYKKKTIQPLVLVCFDGRKENFGIANTGNQKEDLKEYNQFSDFIIRELYPFIKKKVVIQKFHSVAICGNNISANNALFIALNNSDKIQKAGLFYPAFEAGQLESLVYMRKMATVDLMVVTPSRDSITDKFGNISTSKPGIQNTFIYAAEKTMNSKKPTPETFAKFLAWAFPG